MNYAFLSDEVVHLFAAEAPRVRRTLLHALIHRASGVGAALPDWLLELGQGVLFRLESWVGASGVNVRARADDAGNIDTKHLCGRILIISEGHVVAARLQKL